MCLKQKKTINTKDNNLPSYKSDIYFDFHFNHKDFATSKQFLNNNKNTHKNNPLFVKKNICQSSSSFYRTNKRKKLHAEFRDSIY